MDPNFRGLLIWASNILLNGTQKWSQVVWCNTYPANHYITPIIFGPPLFHSTTLGLDKNHSTPSLVHQ